MSRHILVPERAPLFEDEFRRLMHVPNHQLCGRVTQVVGLLVESDGPNAKIGDFCTIEGHEGEHIPAEIVGFKDHRALLMPLGEMHGVRSGWSTGLLADLSRG